MKFKVFHASTQKMHEYLYDGTLSDLENPVHLYRLSVTNPSLFILEMEYSPVATVVCDNFIEAFRLTNSIDYHWSNNPGVDSSIAVKILRSTSVGDLILNMNNRELYIVERVGFRLLGE